MRDMKSAVPSIKTYKWLGFDALYNLSELTLARFILYYVAQEMPDAPHVIFYTKPGCHLCDEARREMARADCRDLYTYEEVDINSDPELGRRYGWDIPVVLIDDTHAFKHRLTAEDFRRAILRAREAGD